MDAWKKWIGGQTFLAILFMVVTMVAGKTRIVRAAAGDVVADRVLGQPNCNSSAQNTVDPEAMSGLFAVAIDKSVVNTNRLYVADTSNNRVLGYSSISALVNGGPASIVIGQPDLFSSGTGTSATTLNGPKAVAVDKVGNLYVADTGNNRVLEYNKPFSSGKTAGLAANMVFGQGLDFTSSQCNFGSNVPAAETMCGPSGVAVDSKGNLFVADTNNNRVLAFKAPFNAATDADVVFGQGGSFFGNECNLGPSNTPPTAATLCAPNHVAVDASNNLYVADTNNNRVLKYNSPLINTTANLVFGQNGMFKIGACNQNGSAGGGTLCFPMGVALDGVGDVFIGDTSNNRVLMFKPSTSSMPTAKFAFGQTSLTATQCNTSGFGSPHSNASLCSPQGVAPDGASANLFIADTTNNRVVRWPYSTSTGPAKTANVVLGQADFAHKSSNTVDATGLSNPVATAIDKSVTLNRLWVVDSGNSRVLGYKSAATFATYAPADIVIGQPDFSSGACNQNSSPAANSLCNPLAAAVDASGNLYVADGGNNRVLMYPKPFSSGMKFNQAASVVFGQGGNFMMGTGVCPPFNLCSPPAPPAGTATQGGMCLPSGVAIDTRPGNGTLYVSDEMNNRVLVFKPPFGMKPLPKFVLGQSTFTGSYPNQQACVFVFPSANSLSGPDQIATDALGNLYVADTDNNRTLEYNTPSVSDAPANRVFGQLGNFTGQDCNLDSENPTIGAQTLCLAEGVAADTKTAPNIYIADTQNNRVLWYSTPLTSGTTAKLVIGQPDFFTNSRNFGGSAPSCKSLSGPLTPAVDSLGNLYVPDAGNNRVLEYDKPDPPPATPTPTPKRTPRPTPTPKK